MISKKATKTFWINFTSQSTGCHRYNLISASNDDKWWSNISLGIAIRKRCQWMWLRDCVCLHNGQLIFLSGCVSLYSSSHVSLTLLFHLITIKFPIEINVPFGTGIFTVNLSVDFKKTFLKVSLFFSRVIFFSFLSSSSSSSSFDSKQKWNEMNKEI